MFFFSVNDFFNSCGIKPDSMFVVKKYCLLKAFHVVSLQGVLALFNLSLFVHLRSLDKKHNSYQCSW